MTLTEPIAVTSLVVDLLESLDVPYLIGGSLASAVYGAVRTTMDVDLVAELRMEHVESLVSALGDAFYVDAGMIHQAIQNRGSFTAPDQRVQALPRDFPRRGVNSVSEFTRHSVNDPPGDHVQGGCVHP